MNSEGRKNRRGPWTPITQLGIVTRGHDKPGQSH